MISLNVYIEVFGMYTNSCDWVSGSFVALAVPEKSVFAVCIAVFYLPLTSCLLV
jgi:hypothetical protein